MCSLDRFFMWEFVGVFARPTNDFETVLYEQFIFLWTSVFSKVIKVYFFWYLNIFFETFLHIHTICAELFGHVNLYL